jgi:hypothetical protein
MKKLIILVHAILCILLSSYARSQTSWKIMLNNVSARLLAEDGDGALYCGTTSNGVYCSLDSGETWNNIYPSNQNVVLLCVDKLNRLIIGLRNDYMMMSDDKGKSWRKLTQQVRPFYYNCINMFIDDSNWYYYSSSTEENGMLMSSDRGNSWMKIDIQSRYDPWGERILGYDKEKAILASVFHWGIYKSTDRGSTWEEKWVDQYTIIFDYLINSNRIEFICGQALYKRSSLVWKSIGKFKSPQSIVETKDRAIYVCDINGLIAVSKDEGETWDEKTDGLVGKPYTDDLMIDKYGHLWVATSNGLYRCDIDETSNAGEDLDDMETKAIEIRSVTPIPASVVVTVEYQINKIGNASIAIYDLLGRRTTIHEKRLMEKGRYRETYDVGNMKSGLYQIAIQLAGKVFVKKLVIVN